MASMKWSNRARRDFKERAEYRKENDEKDRYEKKESERSDNDSKSESERSKDAKEDRMEERGWARMGAEDREALLMDIRNANPDEDVNEKLDRLRAEYSYYEEELDRYDADYDNLMNELNRLRRDNQRYMLRQGTDAREDLDEAKDRQDRDIEQDNSAEGDFDSLWKEREG